MSIAIKKIGVVSPAGVGSEALLGVFREGRCLVKRSQLDEDLLTAEIEEDLKSLIPRRGLMALSRSSLLAAAAIEDLLRTAVGLLPEKTPGECGLVVGTAFGHIESKAEFHHVACREGVRLVSPILFPNTIINSLAGHAAILFGLRGPNSTVTSGRQSGLEALLRASSLLRAGRAARAIVVGCDEVSRNFLHALSSAGVLPPVCPGEASVALLCEEHHGGEPGGGSAVLGESVAILAGSGEASRVGSSLPSAISEAMEMALEEAGVAPRDVGWVSLSVGGHSETDRAELEAVGQVFGVKTPCICPKAFFGETFGAAGTLAVAAAILTARAGFLPGLPSGARENSVLARTLAQEAPWLLQEGVEVPRGPILVNSVGEEGATSVVLEV